METSWGGEWEKHRRLVVVGILWCVSYGRAAVEVLQTGISLLEIGDGYVSATVGDVLRLYSCYVLPALPVAGYERFLSHLKVSMTVHRGAEVELIIAGDFNNHSALWGDRPCEYLCTFAEFLGLNLVNGRGSQLSSGKGKDRLSMLYGPPRPPSGGFGAGPYRGRREPQ